MSYKCKIYHHWLMISNLSWTLLIHPIFIYNCLLLNLNIIQYQYFYSYNTFTGMRCNNIQVKCILLIIFGINFKVIVLLTKHPKYTTKMTYWTRYYFPNKNKLINNVYILQIFPIKSISNKMSLKLLPE